MKVEKLNDLGVYQRGADFTRIGNNAVRNARENLHKKGLPIVFSRNGKVFYELPDGEITSINPFETRQTF